MKNKVLPILFWGMIIIYALLALELLFRPATLFTPLRGDFGDFQLVPFRSILDYLHMGGGLAFRNLAGNIVAFIPYGIYLQVLKKDKRVGVNALIVAATSIAVELVQALLRVGVTDIDDVFLNTLGGFIGILIYRLVLKLAKGEARAKTAITIASAIVGIPLAVIVLITAISRL